MPRRVRRCDFTWCNEPDRDHWCTAAWLLKSGSGAERRQKQCADRLPCRVLADRHSPPLLDRDIPLTYASGYIVQRAEKNVHSAPRSSLAQSTLKLMQLSRTNLLRITLCILPVLPQFGSLFTAEQRAEILRF